MSGSSTKKVFLYGSDFNGLGEVVYNWSQDCSFIAVAGEQKLIYILDKRGKKMKETAVQGKGKILSVEWDKDNEIVCIVQEGQNFVWLWNVFGNNNLTQLELDSTKAKATIAKWSKTHPVLFIGSDKGGLLFYNKKNQKKIPTMGKHAKKVISGDWNKEGLLITGGEDKILTVSNYNSDTVYDSVSVKNEPRKVCWATPKTDSRDQPQRTITAVLAQKSILMYELGSKTQPLELVFEQRYGKIIQYELFGDGYIVVAFSEGYVAHISTHKMELKDEVSSERIFQSTLDAITTNDVVYKMAVAGENMIKIYNLATWKEIKSERIELPKNAGKVQKLQWSQNGQLLVASTANGYIFGFLTSIPQLTSTFGSITAVLSSFTEVQIYDTSKQGASNQVSMVTLSTEPAFVTLGPYHIATGINNMVWYYLWLDQSRNGVIKGGDLVQKRDYFGSVRQVCINGFWAAVLADGKCILHTIDPQAGPQDVKEKKFPQTDQEKGIYQIALTKDFLIMLDVQGKLKYYHLQDLTYILEFKPEVAITKFYNNFSGTRCILIDNKGKAYFFEAANEYFREIQNFPQKVDSILWDQQDHNLFSVLDNDQMLSYLINKNNIYGIQILPVKELLSIDNINSQDAQPVVTVLDRGVKPLGMTNGFLKCFTPNATIQGQYLTSHSFLASYKWEEDTKEGHYRYFLQNISLNKFSNALFAASYMENMKLYEALGRKALESVELEVALKSFQLSKNLAMVMTIQSFAQENEKNIIFGNVAMILGSYDLAQELFLKSTKPIHALHMRSDIQDYLIALNLAKSIAPEQEPHICKRLAMQIESQGNDSEAKNLYEKALLKDLGKASDKQKNHIHNMQCQAGIARTSIKSGDIKKGIKIAKTLTDKSVVIEIAVVCENMQQLLEAAELYENANMLEKAATLYIQLKEFNKAGPLMNLIQSNKLLSLYAKSKEAEGGFLEAEKYYEKAEDWENVIRLNLSSQIDNFEKAKLCVRNKCPTSTCAQMVATECDKLGYKEEAVEFLVIAGKKEEAFIIAQTSHCMEIFENTLKETKSKTISLTTEDAIKIATFYESQGSYLQAAENYQRANNPTKALKLFIKVGEECIPQMVTLVKENKTSQALVQHLISYLSGELGDGPKDPKYLLDLQYAMGNIKQVVSISLTIAQDSMESANYKQAHETLFSTYQKLKEEKIGIQYDLEQKLMLIHSYQIVKRVVKTDDHDNAAWLLHRVSSNISSFASSKINILTSAVIEAIRSQNKPLAYKWSVELIRPENRPHINEKYKKNIENIARKPIREEPQENKTNCPFCQHLVPEFKLDCSQCQNQIPFCIASGKHIIAEQLCFCPHCTFPANINYFKRILQGDKQCPMCDQMVEPNELVEAGEKGIEQLKIIRQGEKQDKK